MSGLDFKTQITNALVMLAQNINHLAQQDNIFQQANEQKLLQLRNDLEALNFSIVIDDASNSSSDKTYSINKIKQLIATAKDEILGGAPGALDTLKELADLLNGNADGIASIIEALGRRVAVDQSQSFDEGQKLQARQNISAVGQTEFNALKTALGDLNHDFAAEVQAVLDAGTLPS